MPESPRIPKPKSLESQQAVGSWARAEMRGSLVALDASLDERRDPESRPG